MSDEPTFSGGLSCWLAAAIFLLGLLVLAVRLQDLQIDARLDAVSRMEGQSTRRVRTAGPRGRILDRYGRVLAGNRPSVSIALNPEFFQRKRLETTAQDIRTALDEAGAVIGVPSQVTDAEIRRHLNIALARPLVVWSDITPEVLARFSEHARELPGFTCLDLEVRSYPQGTLASHLLGYVGRERVDGDPGGKTFRFLDYEMRGRAGIEDYYDGYLRGVSGETSLTVDARGYVREQTTVVEAQRGPDLVLTIDSSIQAAAEEQLRGCRGACAVIDPRTGDVLALASAPGFDPNEFVPVLRQEVYDRLAKSEEKPLLNRAVGGTYAPGSTFKPITALAGLGLGHSDSSVYECIGFYQYGDMRIRCARTWGHGGEDMRTALRDSCNAYFCNLGMQAGSNAVITAARAFGLGSRTGLDFGLDAAGLVPDAGWKAARLGERWYPGDLAQMSIGQGQLLVSPLQMARVAGALGTGRLVTPRLKTGLQVSSAPLPFPARHMKIVREGMRLVVDGGTGRRGADGVDAWVIGKTGTAEVGRGERRRKNTWFIAYAESCGRTADGAAQRVAEPDICIAVAMVIENGESGGGTTAPKVREVLKRIYGTEDGHVE